MEFVRAVRQKVYDLLSNISERWSNCWFWRGRAFAVTVWLLPLPLLVVRVIYYLRGLSFTPSLYWSIYGILFLSFYSYLFSKEEKFFFQLYASAPVGQILRWGGRAEDFLFRRIGLVFLLSVLVLKLLILWWIDVFEVLPSIVVPTLRVLSSFYICLRTLVMYEELLGEYSIYRDIPSFREASRVFYCPDLTENRVLLLFFIMGLILGVQCLGAVEGYLEKRETTTPLETTFPTETTPPMDGAQSSGGVLETQPKSPGIGEQKGGLLKVICGMRYGGAFKRGALRLYSLLGGRTRQ